MTDTNTKEKTFELTNYCPNTCKYCSSNTTTDINKAIFLDIKIIEEKLKGKIFEHIILSGGEPLAHPLFFQIYNLCKQHTNDVVVYSNLITHRVFNANVIDGVYLEANLTLPPEVDKVHILRRVKQGREINRPEVHLSHNYLENCSCNHRVIIPSGKEVLTPCNKDFKKIRPEKYGHLVYISGAHGVGKSTMLMDVNEKLHLNQYENPTKNPYKDNVYMRQLWRLYKYKFDDEVLTASNIDTIVSRCCIDWLIYTKTFFDLGWLNKDEYDDLLNKYEIFFPEVPNNIVFINPGISWSIERIKSRWETIQKWREENFDYYYLLRENYEKMMGSIIKSKTVNVLQLEDINRINRVSFVREFISIKV